MTTTRSAPTTLPALVTWARVTTVERPSPAFVRVSLTAPEFADLGDPGLDSRIKLGFPSFGGELPDLSELGAGWYAAWQALPATQRPALRTYTIRDVRRGPNQTLLVVDLVVHGDDAGAAGPACRWARQAEVGRRVLVVAPRAGSAWGGVEFDPAGRRELLLAGDETALPAVTRILSGLGPGHTGHAFLEIPQSDDIVEIDAPTDLEVHWTIRDQPGYGRPLVAEVRRHLGLAPLGPDEAAPDPPSTTDVEVWETPGFSSAGEDVAAQLAHPSPRRDPAGLYAWIAGEAWAVKQLRRSLVTELELDRDQVTFMGYWREGVAMRS